MDFAFLIIGVFAGALVSGFAGFAFSAVAGAFLLHVMPPIEAARRMMACSILVQGVSLRYSCATACDGAAAWYISWAELSAFRRRSICCITPTPGHSA